MTTRYTMDKAHKDAMDYYAKCLRAYFEGYAIMAYRFPRAAKKRRIKKKWEKRFGKPVDWAALLSAPSLFDLPEKKASWTGGVMRVPLMTNIHSSGLDSV